MKQLVVFVGLICSALTATICNGNSSASIPTVITFGEESRDFGDYGPAVENGFQYEAKGQSWALINGVIFGHGGDGNALATFWGLPHGVGNVAVFKRLDGAAFVFEAFDLRGVQNGPQNDTLLARGFFDGVEIASQVIQSSDTVWTTALTGPSFATQVNELRFELIEVSGGALLLDNLVFAPVPEPTSGMLLMLGLGVVVWNRRHRPQ